MKFITALFVFFAAFSFTYAQQVSYRVMSQKDRVTAPVYLYYSPEDKFLHTIGKGYDANGNGEFDEGDIKPQWYMELLDNGANPYKKKFEFELKTIKDPLRPGIDEENQLIYIPHPGKIKAYDMVHDNDADPQDIAEIDADAIDVVNSYLLLATNPDENEKGELQVYSLVANSVLQTVPIGYNFRDVKHFYSNDGSLGIALLSDVQPDGGNSMIHFGKLLSMGEFTLDSIIIGKGANEIRIKDSIVVATCMGSDEIYLLNVNTGEATSHKLSLGDYAPNSSVFAGNAVYTATSYGDIRKTDLSSGNMIDIAPSPNKSYDYIESYNDEYLYVADTENNLVSIFQKITLDNTEDYDEYEVGKEPVDVFYNGNLNLHIFCKGYDANFNGVYEEELGDEKPSWWSIAYPVVGGVQAEPSGIPYKILDFEFGSFKAPMLPMNIARDINNEMFYIPLNGQIKAFDYYSSEEIPEKSIYIDANSAYWDGHHLIVTEPTYTGTDYVKIMSPGNDTPLMTIEAGENVVEAIDFDMPDGKKGIIIGNVGNFAEPNASTIQYGTFNHKEQPELTTYNIGSTLNDIDMEGDIIAMTLNGSHTIKVIDINEGPEKMKTFSTGTYGWDGPRDVKVYYEYDKYYIYFTTYAGDIRTIDLETGVLTEIQASVGKTEGLDVFESYTHNIPAMIVANISKPDYSSNNIVTIYNYNPSSVIEYKNKTISNIKLYPNPAVDNINIETDKMLPGVSLLEIFDISGNKLVQTEINSLYNNNIDLRSYNLSSGYYMIRIINNNEIYSMPLEIKK